MSSIDVDTINTENGCNFLGNGRTSSFNTIRCKNSSNIVGVKLVNINNVGVFPNTLEVATFGTKSNLK